jgi:putative SOS response-associated peptidase YedK
MCGRYTLHKKTAELRKRFEVTGKVPELRDNFNVAPGQIMPVVTEDQDGRHLELMKWGLIPFWAKDPGIGYKMINARAEGIFDKPAWRSVIKRKRALIPADGFYEWKKESGEKQPYYIHPRKADIFAFAGVWETWKDPDNNVWKTYSIITTEPNAEMRAVHDRMPVILHPEDEASWLSPSLEDPNEIEPFLAPFEDGGLEMFAVSRDVNVVRNNDAKLIYPLNSQ